ncbi:MAG: GTP-binding protein [Intestinimonas sp.]
MANRFQYEEELPCRAMSICFPGLPPWEDLGAEGPASPAGRGRHRSCVCKIDCLKTGDGALFQRMGLPCVTGLSGDICPDHFLVSNLPELWDWADRLKRDTLVIETAGLCHRCSPATQHMTAGCVLDCTASCRASGQLGPMLTQADFVVLTKIDMVSQAELEIISWQIRQINPGAALFPVDGLAGYGTDLLARWLLDRPACGSFEGDILRHTMPSGVCSYCVGEQRVGSAFQQGVVGKINFEEAEVCSL